MKNLKEIFSNENNSTNFTQNVMMKEFSLPKIETPKYTFFSLEPKKSIRHEQQETEKKLKGIFKRRGTKIVPS